MLQVQRLRHTVVGTMITVAGSQAIGCTVLIVYVDMRKANIHWFG